MTATPFAKFFKAVKLEDRVGMNDDEWDYDEEPHIARRKEILAKYPQIKKLMGYDPKIALIVTAEVLVQIGVCYAISVFQPSALTLLTLAYVLGATINHSLGSAIHEIGHNLAFGHKRPWANRILSIWCNLPIGVPMAISYKKYHLDHHKWLGHDSTDVDVPLQVEAKLFKHPVTKVIWLFFHPIIHAFRPFLKSPKPVTGWELINIISSFIFDVIVYCVFGVQAVYYLIVSSYFCFGLHPLAGHFISEHYLFSAGQSTHSYYGPLNKILFNVGYHIEHHDFPYIPYSRLPEVKRIAAPYYDNLPYHTSWLKVMWDFISKDQMGPHARGVNNENKTRPGVCNSVQMDTVTIPNEVIMDKKDL